MVMVDVVMMTDVKRMVYDYGDDCCYDDDYGDDGCYDN